MTPLAPAVRPPRPVGLVVGGVILGIWVVCAIGGELLVPDPYATDSFATLAPPSAEHWLGTDRLGRDVFARAVTGARSILLVAPAATLIGTLIGTALGLVTGYFAGAVDDVVSRLVSVVLSLPVVIVALLALVALGPSSLTVIGVIGFIFSAPIARTVRAAVRVEREKDYVEAARLRREPALAILFVEILPNVLGPVLTEATVRLGYAVFFIATLSFLGFGIQPPSPDWGLAIYENYTLLRASAWPVIVPAVAIASLVVSVHLVAEGLVRRGER
ncbi:MAG: ABC transporter permease [Pseudonocardia sp.]|nr:ABC transporter permease [Pseudonocardia sp.]